jgi:Protein of unknown function (DUF3489)
MTTEQTATADSSPKPEPSKSDTVKKLLSRKTGATIEELGAATNWQPHSVRAFLSGLRKKGATIVREESRNGAKAYRIAKAAEGSDKQ